MTPHVATKFIREYIVLLAAIFKAALFLNTFFNVSIIGPDGPWCTRSSYGGSWLQTVLVNCKEKTVILNFNKHYEWSIMHVISQKLFFSFVCVCVCVCACACKRVRVCVCVCVCVLLQFPKRY
jgi:hypothetical protein